MCRGSAVENVGSSSVVGETGHVTVLLITVDTNELDEGRIQRLRGALDVPHELACVTVTARERGSGFRTDLRVVPETVVWGESRWGEGVWGGPIPELLVLGESPLGLAVLGSDGHVDVLETALGIISAGSFPKLGSRDELSYGERRQLRDAMIFEAHVGARRHLFVTKDEKGFTRHGRRERLQTLGQTWIRLPSELESAATAGELAAFLKPPG